MNTIDKIAELLNPEFDKLDHVKLVKAWVLRDYDPVEGSSYDEVIENELDLVVKLLVEQEIEFLEKNHQEINMMQCEDRAREKAPGMLAELMKQVE